MELKAKEFFVFCVRNVESVPLTGPLFDIELPVQIPKCPILNIHLGRWINSESDDQFVSENSFLIGRIEEYIIRKIECLQTVRIAGVVFRH